MLLRRVERRMLLRREERFLVADLRALGPLRAILYFFVRF